MHAYAPWKPPRGVALVGDDPVLVRLLQRHVRQPDGSQGLQALGRQSLAGEDTRRLQFTSGRGGGEGGREGGRVRKNSGKEGGREQGCVPYLMESGSRGWEALVLAKPSLPGADLNLRGGC